MIQEKLYKEIGKICNRPYPESNSKKEILISSFFIAITGYLFLIIFQPFGTYNYSNPFKYVLLTPYSIISFTVIASINIFLRNKFNNWNMIREAIKIYLVLTICSTFNYLYNIKFINNSEFRVHGLIYMSLYTLAVGIPVYLISFLGRYISE